jgi:hypothetical protein
VRFAVRFRLCRVLDLLVVRLFGALFLFTAVVLRLCEFGMF